MSEGGLSAGGLTRALPRAFSIKEKMYQFFRYETIGTPDSTSRRRSLAPIYGAGDAGLTDSVHISELTVSLLYSYWGTYSRE